MCYCNSVLQLLYFCKPFRDCVNNYPLNRNLPIETQKSYQRNESRFSNSALSEQTAASSNKASSAPASNLPKISNSISKGSNLSKTDHFASESYFDDANSAQRYGVTISMFTALKDLFWHITTRISRSGTYNPNRFITTLKQNNALFRNNFHQDAHEMLNYLMNEISENVEHIQDSKNLTTGTGKPVDGPSPFSKNTWVHTLFEGLLTNETKCLTCEKVTSRDETFFDLSVDISNNTSVTNCMRQFAAGEIMNQNNKFLCENCGTLQEAERRMRIKRLPNILALHLKRFKYKESIGNYVKLNYRVNYPLTMRVPDTTQSSEDVEYKLVGTIIHLGSGLHQGHYIVIVKSGESWIIYDDDYVDIIHESDLELYFGDSLTYGGVYVLLYERSDFDPLKYDLPGNSFPKTEFSAESDAINTNTNLAPPNNASEKTKSFSVPPFTSSEIKSDFVNAVNNGPIGYNNQEKANDITTSTSTKIISDNETKNTPEIINPKSENLSESKNSSSNNSEVSETNLKDNLSEPAKNSEDSNDKKEEKSDSTDGKDSESKSDDKNEDIEVNEFSSSSILSNLIKNKGTSSLEDAIDTFLQQSSLEISIREPTLPPVQAVPANDKADAKSSSGSKIKWNIFSKNKDKSAKSNGVAA
ncbi:putative ubiquitin carboxyl-terminal hydrolase creB [Smittium culicis]|uniref:ubiquitinyl hydrolase 1 n=1 Tax=Smittium culicis TaxID=133412 RepID=A0A1R1XAS8_9FUNG|nr:putative ubiquitin carboxyl-terminal hydrolase creB [Smittium culicis]